MLTTKVSLCGSKRTRIWRLNGGSEPYPSSKGLLACAQVMLSKEYTVSKRQVYTLGQLLLDVLFFLVGMDASAAIFLTLLGCCSKLNNADLFIVNGLFKKKNDSEEGTEGLALPKGSSICT